MLAGHEVAMSSDAGVPSSSAPNAEDEGAVFQPSPAPRRLTSWWLWALHALALAVLGATTLIAHARGDRWLLGVGGTTALGIFFVAGLASLVTLLRATFGEEASLATWLSLMGAGAVALAGAMASFVAMLSMGRGRQLRRFGRMLLPKVGAGAAWASRATPAEVLAPIDRAGVARQWRENGRTEHASVAAFARLSLELMALGAPPALLESSSRDALDEIRHAELCFSLARALDGEDRGPQPFPEARTAPGRMGPRALALARLAVDSLVDGAMLEGFSARLIASLVARCEDPATRSVLKALAADEGRHSKHGWDVLRWCLDQGGAPVAHALRGAIAVLPAEPRSTLPEGARSGAWERYGIPGVALEADAYRHTRAHVVQRVEALVGAMRRAA